MPEAKNQKTPLQDKIEAAVNAGQRPKERLASQLDYTMSINPPACGDRDNCNHYKELRTGRCSVAGCNASKKIQL